MNNKSIRRAGRGGGGGGLLSAFGRFNERGEGGGGGGASCPFSAGSTSGEGAVRVRLHAGKKVFLDKRGGCNPQTPPPPPPPPPPPLHFIESIAFLATNLLCGNDCGYDNDVST